MDEDDPVVLLFPAFWVSWFTIPLALLFVDAVVVDVVDVVTAPDVKGRAELWIETGITFVEIGWADDVRIVVVFETTTLLEGVKVLIKGWALIIWDDGIIDGEIGIVWVGKFWTIGIEVDIILLGLINWLTKLSGIVLAETIYPK